MNDSKPKLWPLKLALLILVVWNLEMEDQINHRVTTNPGDLYLAPAQQALSVATMVEGKVAIIETKLAKHGW